MKMILITAIAVILSACSSLDNAGVAEYSIKPFVIGEQTICCEVTVKNGKEYASLKAKIVKKGDDYSVELDETGIAAFRGQELAAGAAKDATATAVSAATKAAAAVAGVGALPALGVIAQ